LALAARNLEKVFQYLKNPYSMRVSAKESFPVIAAKSLILLGMKLTVVFPWGGVKPSW
jgi:hypothetical protein